MLEALKSLFGNGPLTYDQLEQAVAKDGKLKFVNLADGQYVSKQKFDDETSKLATQVTDLKGQITQRDADMGNLKTQLSSAQADAGKLAEVENQLTSLQAKYDKDSKAFDAKLAKQSYEFAVKEATGKLHFSSESARRAFTEDAMAKGLQMDGGKLLGFDDFVASYKDSDPNAFTQDNNGNGPNGANGKGGKPNIVLPPTGGKKPDAKGFAFHFNGVRPAPQDE